MHSAAVIFQSTFHHQDTDLYFQGWKSFSW